MPGHKEMHHQSKLKKHIRYKSIFFLYFCNTSQFFSLFQDCVKTKALSSVLAARKCTNDEAIDAIERVFPKCYIDLEPLGRRIKRNSTDMHRAYMEAPLYGYDVD